MNTDPARVSQVYVVVQFALIAIFAAAVFADVGPRLAAPLPLRWAGALLCVAGLLMMAAALAAMGRVMQVSPMPKEEGRLITRGVYGRLRHPMYTAIILVVIGMALREPTLFVAIAGIALVVLLLAKARFEESLLLQRYADYAEYRRRSWGVIPGIR